MSVIHRLMGMARRSRRRRRFAAADPGRAIERVHAAMHRRVRAWKKRLTR